MIRLKVYVNTGCCWAENRLNRGACKDLLEDSEDKTE